MVQRSSSLKSKGTSTFIKEILKKIILGTAYSGEGSTYHINKDRETLHALASRASLSAGDNEDHEESLQHLKKINAMLRKRQCCRYPW